MNRVADVVVRVDANSEIGLGHLRRCMTLIRQLYTDRFTVHLVGRYRFGKVIESLIEGISISWLEDTEIAINPKVDLKNEVWDAEGTLSIIGRHPNALSWVIVDHYGLSEQWEKIIREAGHRVLVIDDFRHRSHFADVLVSDTNASFDPALNGCPDDALELVGAQYALIDPEFTFSEKTSHSLESKKRFLVSYGGSDPTDETTKALEAISNLRLHKQYREWVGSVDVVVGQANTRVDGVVRLANSIKDVIVHVAPQSLAPLMRKADLLLTAGGNSMVEGLAMRLPCLITQTSDNQALMVAHLLEQRAIHPLGNHVIVGPVDIAKAVINILSEYESFVDNLRVRPIFDHLGAQRISAAIQSIPKQRMKPQITHTQD